MNTNNKDSRILKSIRLSKGMQIGLPNNLFYYQIPNDFEVSFNAYNERLKEKVIFVNNAQVNADKFKILAQGEPMTPDNEPQMLITDSSYKIYYCYSLTPDKLELKILFNSVTDCLSPYEEVMKRLENNEFVTINIKQKKLAKIITLAEIIKFDFVALEKDIKNLSKLLTELFKLKKIDIGIINIKKENDKILMEIPTSKIKRNFSSEIGLSGLIEAINKDLERINFDYSLAIIHEIKWDQQFGIGLFNEKEIENLRDNFYFSS